MTRTFIHSAMDDATWAVICPKCGVECPTHRLRPEGRRGDNLYFNAHGCEMDYFIAFDHWAFVRRLREKRVKMEGDG